MVYVAIRTNYRRRGVAVVDMKNPPAVLTALGAQIPTGYLCYSQSAICWYNGDKFFGFLDCSHSTGA